MKHLAALALSACAAHTAPATPATSSTIDVQIDHADVHDALATIAGAAHINVFADPDLPGTVTLTMHAAWQDVLARVAEERALRIEPIEVKGTAAPAVWVTLKASPPAPQTTFGGDPVALSLDETPIREAVKPIAEAAKLPIVVADDVQTPVTMRFRGVPWDLALYHIAQKYHLRVERSASEIRLATSR